MQQDELIIRHAATQDIEALYSLMNAFNDFYQVPRPERSQLLAIIQQLCENAKKDPFLVAETKGQLIGFLSSYCFFSLAYAEPILFISEIFILPAYQHQHVGSSLLSVYKQIYQEGQYRYAYGVVSPDNQTAFNLYLGNEAKKTDWVVMKYKPA